MACDLEGAYRCEFIAGVDEAGRGPLAGPVVAAAVILDIEVPKGLGDSKQKTARQRSQLYTAVLSQALAVGVGVAHVVEIERLNILQATMTAMRRAVENLSIRPDQILVDGKHCPDVNCAATAIVGGDARVSSISAASIVAKVTRDRMMVELDALYPEYGFARHKGYPTAAHLKALERCGVSAIHRRTFAPVRRLLCGVPQT